MAPARRRRWHGPWTRSAVSTRGSRPVLRFVGPYQEALARLRGEPSPGLFTRASNLLWLGRTRLGR